jgi:hypothetical protein
MKKQQFNKKSYYNNAYTQHGTTTSAKRNTDRKRSSYIEKDCFEKSDNYYSTGDTTRELNSHLEDRFHK